MARARSIGNTYAVLSAIDLGIGSILTAIGQAAIARCESEDNTVK